VLANVLGGDLAVTSTPGVGSVFRFRVMLPTPNSAPRAVAQGSRITGYQGQPRHVLVIDDDPAQRAILQSLLCGLGFVVHAAPNGAEGIALAARVSIDIVLLDIQMPGLGGWEVAERLREAHGTPLRIVMVSADAHEFRAGGDGRSSHDAFVTKPVELVALIGAQLDLRWEETETTAPEALPASPPVPGEAIPFLHRLSAYAKVGHVRGMQGVLDELDTAVPAAAPLVSTLRRQLNDFDLRLLQKTIDHATH
jgi:CheY-like chemotaxis protein